MMKKKNYNYLYYADVTNLKVEEALNNVPAFRKEKAMQYRSLTDKKLSLGAWILLKKAFLKHHIDIDKLAIKYNENKKPYFDNLEYDFSISHSGNMVIVGINRTKIGVDIEQIRNINLNILKKIGNDDDIAFTSNDSIRFFKIWTSKEAILKLQGIGINKKINQIDLKNNKYNIYNLLIDDHIIAIATDNNNKLLLRKTKI